VNRAASFGGLVRARSGDMLRPRSRPLWAVWMRAAPLLVLVLGAAPVLAPEAYAGPPEPDPYQPTTANVLSPTPDPHPSARDPAPAQPRTSAPPSTSPQWSPPTVSTAPASSQRPTASQKAVAKPKPEPRATAEPKPRASATRPQAPGRSTRNGSQSIRVAGVATSAAVSASPTPNDPMILGGLALLTLAFSSAGMLLVIGRWERRGAGA
jgi:hypothetical protein